MMTIAGIVGFLETPLGAALLVVLAYRLSPSLSKFAPLFQMIANLFPATKSTKPTDPAQPQPVPLSPDGSPAPATKLIDAAVLALKALAQKRFPWLAADKALFDFAGELHQEEEKKVFAKAVEAEAREMARAIEDVKNLKD